MSTALVARTAPMRSRSTEILCAGSLSIVVEGVDGENADEQLEDDVEKSIADLSEDSCISSPHGGSRRGSRASTKEETETKIALFKTEAAARLNELERLLDEHSQIIRELQRSESTGGLHVIGTDHGSGVSSAPLPATPVDGTNKAPGCRTVPSSPSLGKFRHCD